jgi:predicted TIM-barrel fold metal-dependent hydrolase
MRKKHIIISGVFILVSVNTVLCQKNNGKTGIIDTHFHALKWNSFGDPPPPNEITGVVPQSLSDSEEQATMFAELKKNNIVIAMTSGVPNLQRNYKHYDKERIVEGLLVENERELPDTATFVQMIKDKKVKVLGELGLQYFGKVLTDAMFEPYLSICERFNIPVALHTGISFPNTPYTCCPQFRTYFGNPQLIEDALVKHPKLKVQLMHMGYPYLEETKAILAVYPQVNVDVAAVDWLIPQAEFYNYLRALIDAGFEKRIMYGSDQMVWSDAISLSIKNIENAPFLSEEQKRDIFYNNAARFFDLDK